MSGSQKSEPSDLPVEVRELYQILYKKIEKLVDGGSIDLKDPTTLRVFIESAMAVVENFRNDDDEGWSGPEKKRYALMLIKLVIQDLAADGKIEEDVAEEIVTNLDFWGGIAMDMAVDAMKKLFDVGQEFIQDTRTDGCKESCHQNCCCCIV